MVPQLKKYVRGIRTISIHMAFCFEPHPSTINVCAFTHIVLMVLHHLGKKQISLLGVLPEKYFVPMWLCCIKITSKKSDCFQWKNYSCVCMQKCFNVCSCSVCFYQPTGDK